VTILVDRPHDSIEAQRHLAPPVTAAA